MTSITEKELHDKFIEISAAQLKEFGVEGSPYLVNRFAVLVWKELLPLITQYGNQREVAGEKNGVAWAIKEIDDMHFNTMNQPVATDGLFKGIKNSLRDRCKLQAGYDPAPNYPIAAELQAQQGEQDE